MFFGSFAWLFVFVSRPFHIQRSSLGAMGGASTLAFIMVGRAPGSVDAARTLEVVTMREAGARS
jgi:hypothetical protein